MFRGRKGKAYPVAGRGGGCLVAEIPPVILQPPSLASSSYRAGGWQQVLARLAAV